MPTNLDMRRAASGAAEQATEKSSNNLLALIGFIAGACLLMVVAKLFLFETPAQAMDTVIKDRYQAISVVNGDVFFGRVDEMNENYIKLNDVFYLNIDLEEGGDANAQTQSASTISIAKRGCELFASNDSLQINMGEVGYWENIRSDSEVTQTIDKWFTDNPNGYDCASIATEANAQPPQQSAAPAPAATPKPEESE